MIGQTISHYKILEKLGEGGMGIVYKAQDTTLDRFVALKFLPAHLSSSTEDKARFMQEARSAAALNHSNICTIYGIEEADGKNFIVMELIDGVTLHDKFTKAPLSIKEAVGYAIQVGEALEEAHGKGIVHRDIKSDNIMLTKKDQVKVMDFGLAKLKGSAKLTRATSTVGTLGYMAPEQIQGSEADIRSDVFSFGVVLYELLTGRLPFRGEHEAAMVYSIVNEDPEPLEKFVPQASPELIHIITTALEKDPNDRYQTAAEMTRELRRLLKQSSRVSRGIGTTKRIPLAPMSEDEPQAAPRSNKMLWIGIVAAVVVVGGVVGFLMMNKKTEEVAAVGATLNPNTTLRVLSIPFAQFSYPGLSADGNWVAFPAADAGNKWDIFYMHVSGSETRRISVDSMFTGENVNADISPDGSQVVYSVFGNTGAEVKIVSTVGGASRTIVTGNIALPRWRPDGQRVGYVRIETGRAGAFYSLWSVKPDGSDNRAEYTDSLALASRFSYAWAPDGKSVAWIRTFKEGYQEVFTHELSTNVEHQLTFDKKNNDDVAWTRNGFVIFSSNRSGNTNLWMVPATGGTPQQLTKGSGPDIGISISADNQKLVYLQQQRVGHVWISEIASGASRQITFDEREITGATISPDGKTIAMAMRENDPLKPGVNLFLQDRASGNRRQLTNSDLQVGVPRWSPDGKWVAFSTSTATDPADSSKLYIVEASNAGPPKLLGLGTAPIWLTSTKLGARRANRPYDDILSVDGAPAEKFYQDSTVVQRSFAGEMVAYFDRRKPTQGLWLIPVSEIGNAGKVKPRKLADPPKGTTFRAWGTNFIYYMNQAGELGRLSVATGKTEPVKGSFPGVSTQSPIGISFDDKEILSIPQQLSAKLVMVENIFK